MKKKDNTLTKVEFQVMSILWDINHSACAWDIIERRQMCARKRLLLLFTYSHFPE